MLIDVYLCGAILCRLCILPLPAISIHIAGRNKPYLERLLPAKYEAVIRFKLRAV